MPGNISPIPAGAYLELDIDPLDDGKAKTMLAEAMREVVTKLKSYEKVTGDGKAAATVTLKLKVRRQPNTQQFYSVEYGVAVAAPAVKRAALVKEAGGRLLCQPDGAHDSDPDQIPLFDRDGRIIAGIDPLTGESAGQAPLRMPAAQ